MTQIGGGSQGTFPTGAAARARVWLARSRFVGGPLVTIAVAALIELTVGTRLHVANPPAFLMLAIVWSGFLGGPFSGVLSAAIAWAYTAYFFADPGLHFTDENLRRVIVWGATMPFTAFLVGLLNRRAAAALVQVEVGALREARLREQALASETLRESERRLEEAQQIARVGWWDYDLAADRVTLSGETCRLFGLPPEHRSYPFADWHRRWQGLIHPEDRERAAEAATACLRGGARHNCEYRVILPGGAVRTVHSQGDVTFDEDGRARRQFGTVQDITELRHTEDELRRSEEGLRESQERLRLAVQAAGLGPWDWDLRTNVVVFSPEWKRQIGYEDHEIPGRYDEWERRLHPDDRERVIKELQEYLEGRRPEYAVEFRLRHKDGSYRWIFTRGTALRDTSGRPSRVLGCHLDVTDAKRLEEQFRQAQKMEAVGRLAGGVAHDFNNLLTVILGCSGIALNGLRADDPARELLTEIQQAADRAATLTRQLLAFSRRQVLQPRVVDLNALLKELVNLLTRLIGEDITLTVESDDALGAVNVDPGQFEQAVMNLVVNARDAMPAGGHLRIETRNAEIDTADAVNRPEVRPGRFARVTVADTGLGMDEAVKARVFEPFFTTKESSRGTGLGLAMVYGFVTQSGGHIEVESEIGRGSSFALYLPHAAEHASSSATYTATAEARLSPGGTETILLVEDEDAVRSLTRLVLQSNGYTVLEARDGEAGVLVAQQHVGPIHLVITDLVMPRMGGLQLAQLVSRGRPDVRTLFISGYSGDADVLRAGGGFLQKPFNPMSLAWKVREVLDNSGEQTEARMN